MNLAEKQIVSVLDCKLFNPPITYIYTMYICMRVCISYHTDFVD